MILKIIQVIRVWFKEYLWVLMWISAMLIPWPK